MKKLLFILLTITTNAQIKGIVTDSLTKQPIAYAVIMVEGTQIGTSSEADGTFTLSENHLGKNLIVDVMGYAQKKQIATKNISFQLNIQAKNIETVVVKSRKPEKPKEKDFKLYKGYSNLAMGSIFAPLKFAHLITLQEKHEDLNFLKEVSIMLSSPVDSCLMKLRFCKVNLDGKPGDDIVENGLIINIEKTCKLDDFKLQMNDFNVSSYEIEIPVEGVFVVFETLFLDQNKYISEMTGADGEHISYAPSFGMGKIHKDIRDYWKTGNDDWVKRNGHVAVRAIFSNYAGINKNNFSKTP